MSDFSLENLRRSFETLKTDMSIQEFAGLATDWSMSEDQIEAIDRIFDYLQEKKIQTTIHTIMRMSRLPLKDPKTFENFDFSLLRGRDVQRLQGLQSLSAVYSHRNIAFITGQPGAVTKERLAGFYKMCAELGIRVPEGFVREGKFHDPEGCAALIRELL